MFIYLFDLNVIRCRSSTEDMVKMIKIEFENLKELQKDIEDESDAEAEMKKGKRRYAY